MQIFWNGINFELQFLQQMSKNYLDADWHYVYYLYKFTKSFLRKFNFPYRTYICGRKNKLI